MDIITADLYTLFTVILTSQVVQTGIHSRSTPYFGLHKQFVKDFM